MKLRRYQFTLVEILVVIAIIGILTGIGLGTYSYAMGKSKESATTATMKQIETALENAKAKHGFYPASTGTLNPDRLIYLMTTGNNPEGVAIPMNATAEYMKTFTKTLDLESLRQYMEAEGSDMVLIDAWGERFIYRSPGQINKQSFDLISAGPDGKFGKDGKARDQMLGNYVITDFKDNDGNLICDDIVNF